MGNEGSIEGGEGMGGFPEGMAGDGKGGFARIPAGMEADLSQLSEEERKQIAAVMSRAQELPRGNQTDRPPLRYPNIDTNQSPRHPSKPPDPGPTGLSKSRTVDAFKTEMKTPGRSPSTMSLKEPRSKHDIKEEQKPSMMTGFLTDSNPLSVVSSVVNKFNPFDAKPDPGASPEENMRKQKEHEKIEDPRGSVKPPHLQQSPGHTQHPRGPTKSTDTIIPTQQQPSKPAQPQSGPKPVPLEQSTSKISTQTVNTTKPPLHIPSPKETLSHTKDPIKPLAPESEHTTSSFQVQEPNKEPIKHDRSVIQGPMDLDKQNLQQSRPLTQSRYPSEVGKVPPHTVEPAKKPIKKEPEIQPTQSQGPAKQSMQQAGSTEKTTQQVTNIKQQIQQTLPLQQQVPVKQPQKQQALSATSVTSKQTAQKPELAKPPETKHPSQSPRKPILGLNQSAKMLPQQQGKAPEKIPEPKQQEKDSTQEMSKVSKKTICPLCGTTELFLNTKEKANYNTCTECHTTVCSLCGFNPNPHMTEIHEWLCLNCQMQRALGMAPPSSKPSPVKQKPASALPPTKPPESSQRKQSIGAPDQNLAQVSKLSSPVLTKPLSGTDSPTSKSKKSFEPETGNVPSKAELMEKSQQLPENKQQQTKPAERVHGMSSSQVVPTKLHSLLPKGPPSTEQKDIDSKTRNTAQPIKVEEEKSELPVSQPVQESKQLSTSNTHPKLPPKPETSQLKEDPKSSPSKINTNLNDKQVKKEAQGQASPKPSPSHKPVVLQTMSQVQSQVKKDPQVQPSPKPSPSNKPVVPQTMSRTQPQVQKDPQVEPCPKPSPSHKPVIPHTSQAQTQVQKDPQVQPNPKPSPSHKPMVPQTMSQVQPQVQKDQHVQPSPKPSPSHKPVLSQTTSQSQSYIQKDAKVQPSPKPSPSHKPVSQQAISQAQPDKSQGQSRRFSLNLGSTTETPKHQPTTPQDTVTGKLFGFGASIFSQASSFISTATQPSSQTQNTQGSTAKQPPPSQQVVDPPATAKDAMHDKPLHTPQKSSELLKTAKEALPPKQPHPTQKTSELPTQPIHVPQSPKHQVVKKESEPLSAEKTEDLKYSSAKDVKHVIETGKETIGGLHTIEKISDPKKLCPLCETELNIGAKDLSNFNTCTECKNVVCNMCGFNPTPHLTEVIEWLCLNCQTHRAVAGELGDLSKMPPLLGLPSKSSPKNTVSLENQTQVHKVTTSPFTASDQAITEDISKMSNEKVDMIPEEKSIIIPEEKISIESDRKVETAQNAGITLEGRVGMLPVEKAVQHIEQGKDKAELLLSLSENLKKSVALPGKVFPSKDMNVLVPKEIEDIKPPEGTMKPKQDLMIDLSATMLKQIDEATLENRIKLESSQLIENEAGKEKTEKEDDKSDTSSSQQQKSPQGLSDTGYSSDGISGSLGEIPSLIPSDEKDLHKESSKSEALSHENSPSSPSDLAKLESTVLSILEAQTSMFIDEKSRKSNDLYGIYGGQTRVKTKVLPITPESFSSEEEELEDIQEEDEEVLGENGKGGIALRKSHKDGFSSVKDIASRQRHDSLDDSSESENSPVPQRKRRTSNGSSSSDDYKHEDSQGSGDDEDFIRKQIIEMSADEDASGSEDEEFIRTKLKEISGSENQKAESKTKPVAAKCKRLTKKSSASYDDDGIRRHSWHHGDEEDEETYDEIPEPKYRESKSQESEELSVSGGGGLRRFKTIELNSTISNTYSEEPCKQSAMLYYDEEPELEMESLTDSPEERSREERSSSLHASSFTPGTSPTSVSSLDEDSDSSPSHKKISGESKQQRKARHRSHGPVLPTIEDSSEEEELREEEELLKEQEKQRELEQQQQRKGSSKKSKKDKDELRAQRRRERPKTPPSNLSPIEDASPTEELRQAAEMEELHRSSCSEYSPSIESEPEGFEISPEKIIEVQKVYKLPTSVSLYSPTDVTTGAITENKNGQGSLKNAEETYEEILYKAKLYKKEKEKDEVFEKEPLYGGMLIEDYIYESLVEENYDESLNSSVLSSQDNVFDHQVKDLKNKTDDICIDSVEKIIHFDNCYTAGTFHSIVPQEDIVSSSYIVPESHEIIILDNADEKHPHETDTGFYDLISCQNMQLTPGSSPTQVRADFSVNTDYAQSVPVDISQAENLSSISQMETSSLANVISIPDVKITQHFTTEEQEEDTITDCTDQKIQSSAVSGRSETSEEFVPTSVYPAIEDSFSLEFRNIDQQPVIKPEKYTGALLADQKEKEIDDTVMCAATSSSIGPIYSQVFSSTIPTTKTSLASETSVEHVIISVPEATTEITQTAGRRSFDQQQGKEDVTKIMEDTNINIYDKKSESYDLKNYVTPTAVECSLLTKQSMTSTSVTGTVTSSPNLQSATSTVTSVTSKVKSLFRSSSSDSHVPLTTPTPPPPPPLPPPTPSKPTVFSKKRPAPKIPSVEKNTIPGSTNKNLQGVPSLKNNATIISKHHAPPPPVPPKPASIPAGLVFSHRPTESRVTKAGLSEQATVMQKKQGVYEKTEAQPLTMTLNLIPSTECKLPSPTSPLSPHSNKSSPRWTKPSLETYVVITLPSEPGTPTDNVTTETTCWPLQAPPPEQIPQTMETVFSTMSLTQGEKIQTSLDSHPVPGSLPQVIATVSTKTVVSKASDLDSTATILQAEYKEKSQSKQSAKISESNNVIDLRTLSKTDNVNNDLSMDICMDLSSSPPDAKRQSITQGVSSRSISAVQPAVVNLCSESTAMSSVTLPIESYSIVTCSTTLSYTTSMETLVDLGNSMKAPLKLTSKQHEQSSVVPPVEEEVPINLSFGMPAQSVICATTKGSYSPNSISNGCTDISTSQESVDSGVVDLSTTKSHRTMVTVDDTTSAIITEIIEEDKPVDLTAGRRAVCCDVVYKLPFGRSCISQQSSTNLPEDRFGYRDDHYQYDRSGNAGLRGVGMKPSMSDTNLAEAGLFLYKSKNTFDYPIGVTEVAVDLTSGKMTTGEALDYKTKITTAYPETRQVISGIGISAPQYSQARMTASTLPPYGMGSVLRSSNGVVYSSVATPIPSTFAITTQPGSIFSTTVRDLSSFITSDTVTAISNLNQTQPPPRSYNILNTTSADVTDVIAGVESSFPLEVEITTAADLVSVMTTESESFSELTEDESAFLMPPEDGKQQQLHLQRELLELEKIKQQRLAEELEWERQEIQRFREQETFMVQKKLEELQSMKQQLLFQQEEERQAQYMMRQETLAQQQLHIEQIQQLQQQLHQQLEEQKLRQMYQYSYDTNETASPQTTSDQVVLEGQFSAPEDGQYWTSDQTSTTVSGVTGIEMPPSETWYSVQSDGITQYISRPGVSISEMSLKDVNVTEERQLKKMTSMQRLGGMYDELDGSVLEEPKSYKLIVDSGVQTDDEDGAEKGYTGRRRRSKKGVDTSVQTDDEDQDEWDIPTRSRRRSRAGKYSDGNTDADKARHFSKVSSIAVQTVAESSVQTEPPGTIRIPSVRAQVDAKVEIVKHISAPEKSYKGESLGCQTETDADSQSPQYLTDMPQRDKRRPTPLEIGYSSHLHAESSLQVAPSPPKSPKVLYSPISPVSPGTVLESAFVPYEKTIVDDITCSHTEINLVQPPSPKTTKVIQRSLSDPKPLSPTSEDIARTQFQYSDGYMTKTISGTQKKVKRTLPNPPPEETNGIQSPYNTVGSVSRRRICRNTTMARAKILQDIDRELDLVERESSKLRKKQAELDEEEKEIDAKLRYLEMGINRRKEALLKEREKRERAYLQGVAEERDYMSDSEVNSTRPTRIESHLGLDRPQTAPQTEYSPYLAPQTQSETHFVPPTSPYTQFQYQTPTLLTQAPTQYPQQSHYQQPLYHQQVSSYQTQPSFQAVPTMSFTPQQPAPTQQPSYKHQSQMLLMQQKTRQGPLDLDSKLTTHYDVIRNQPLIITPASTDSSYSVPHLGSKYSTLDLRLGLDEKSSMASSPMSSISADSFYADLDHHTSRNYVLIDDIGELTKGSGPLSSAFGLHEKELSKADRILRSVDARRTAEVTDFLAPMTSSPRLHSYGKADEDSMEDPYELKLLKHQIKQEFRRGTENLDPLGGYSPYYHSDSLYRHFPKNEKYSISRLTLEKQAAKQLPPAILYQKQSKHKKALIDPKIAKFSPIQESRDIEPDYSSYLSSSTSSIPNISSKVRLLQDDITYGLRKNITDQQKFLGPALAQNIGTSLSPTLRTSMQDEVDKPYVSGSRSRPSSRPSSIYGLDLSIKRELSSSSLRLKANEAETLDGSFSHVAPSGRTKPSSLPISQSRGRIPIVAQNSEEESPLSPVGQPMGMARAAAGPLPPISADSRDQFGSSHSLPEVQQHMREESRTRGYDRDIAFIMDDFQHAMSDSEAYHLRREETDWFDKPRESRIENGHGIDRKLPDKLSHPRSSLHHEQVNGKPMHYAFPHLRIKLQKDPKDHTVSGNGFGIRVVGGKEVPGNYGEIGAYIAKILPGGDAEHTGRLTEGMQVLEWSGYPLTGKTYEDVQSIISQSSGEAEICVRLDLNMLSNSQTPHNLELHEPTKPVDKTKSPGVDPKQLAAELQKVSQQQAPSAASAVEKGSYIHSGTTSAASSAVPSPGQPGSPSVSKKRHSSKSTEAIKSHSHPITGEIQLQVNYDKHLGNLIIHILQARNLVPRDNNGYSDPFVKVYLLPGRGQVMVVQNASAEYKRRTKHVQKSLNPEWNQTVIYKNISMEQLKKKTLEVTIWDYDRFSSNDFLGEVLIDLSNPSSLDNIPRWYQLKEQSESIDHAKPHSGQSNQQVPKPSVIKSRSHGIFPDPSKDMQVPTIEKSHSSPGSSKSSSEGHLRSHGPSRSQSKTSVTQTHLEDAGAAIAAAEAAVQQLRLQPTAHKSGQSNHARKQHRHSIAGVLPIQRTQSDNLPPPANDSKDQSQLALKKVNSDGSVKTEVKSTTHKPTEPSVSTASSVSSFGSGYSMDSDGSNTTGDNSVFSAPRIGKITQNGQDLIGQPGIPLADIEGKTQVMGEIKIALKKEMKTDGEQLIVEILQCRNITYKFKSPDHLPDLYVKLYVINIATQKRIIKKKTRVCRHDREPSFNETFRFSMSPAGHSLQILLVSNGGKFMKKTLIGEAYIWLDKVDLRKRIVNWHKLLVSSTQTH